MTKELRNKAHERVNSIHEARRSREVAAERARPKPAVPQPGMSPSQELEEMMQGIVLEGRVEGQMSSPTLEENTGELADGVDPDALKPENISLPGTRTRSEGSELCMRSSSSWSDDVDAEEREREASLREGETQEASVPAPAVRMEEVPASFERMEEVHRVLWDRSKAALNLKHWELADRQLAKLREISMGYLEKHRTSLSLEQER